MHPYREAPPPPPLGESPSCFHKTNIENKWAMQAIGGWWHSDECLAWHRRLFRENPKDPRMAEFLATCNKQLREEFRQ